MKAISYPSAARVAVTGAAGFIGSSLVDALLFRGHEVAALDRRRADDVIVAANLHTVVDRPQPQWIHCELAENDLDRLVAGTDTVFHLAAVPGVRSSWGLGFEDYVRSNVIATQRILAACEREGVRRLVLASSSSVYGNTSSASCETDPTEPISPYGVTKLAAEQLGLAHVRRADTRLSVVALRYFTVFGPRQRPGMGINQALLGAMLGVPIPLYGDGTQRREFTYVDDVIAATLAAADIDVDGDATVINVGGGVSTSMLEVLELAAKVTGRTVPVVRTAEQAGDVAATRADLRRAHQLLGYQPLIGLEEGMWRQASWLADLPTPLRAALLPNRLEEIR